MLIIFHLSLMSAATLFLITGISVAMFLRRKKNWLNTHKTFNLAGFFMLLAGAVMAIAAVTTGGGDHFVALHQRMGLAAILLCSATVFLGYYSFKAANKNAIRTVHRWSGRISLIAMVAALILGLRMIGIV